MEPKQVFFVTYGKEENISHSNKRKLFGLLLVIVGLFIILHNFDLVELEWSYVWPVILIIIGVALIFRAVNQRSTVTVVKGGGSRFFGDSSHDYTGEIDGLSINHFIGDIELNLTKVTLKPGVNNLSISAFIGDIRVFVPQDMAVETNCSLTLGDIHVFDTSKGGIFPSITEKTSNYDTAEKKLKIGSNAFIGDIKIRKI